MAIAFADEKFDQAINMKDKAWFTNTIAETSVEVVKRLHQHDPTDSRIQSLVSDAIQRVNDANWTGDFGDEHVREYINYQTITRHGVGPCNIGRLTPTCVDIIDNIGSELSS